ncbi:hypothetical protein Tco_0711588 [Tanacetum coccineum]
MLLLLPRPGFINGQRFLSDLRRLFLLVDLTAPILMGSIHYQTQHQFILQDLMHQRSTPLSTPYPPTTSESSPDSSSERSLDSSSSSAGPSHLGIGDGVGAPTEDGIDIGVDIATSDIRDVGIKRLLSIVEVTTAGYGFYCWEDEEEFKVEASAASTREIDVDRLVTSGTSEPTREDYPDMEILIGRILGIEIAQRRLEAGIVMILEGDLGGWSRLLRGVWDSALSLDMTITRFGMTPEAIEELIAQRVAEALANYEATCAANALEAESQSQNGSDGNNGNGENGNSVNGNGGKGNGGNGNGGNANPK